MEWKIPRTLTRFPTTRPAPERYQPQPQPEAHAGETLLPLPLRNRSLKDLHLEPEIMKRLHPASRVIVAVFAESRAGDAEGTHAGI